MENVRTNSKCWGGHLEIRALSMALQHPVYIYSTQQLIPVIIDGTTCNSSHNDHHHHDDNDNTTTTTTTNNYEKEPIRLSYHLHYYALGEHYNEVVPN